MPRSAEGPGTAAPSSVTRPSVAAWSPAASRRRVDLPQPDGPTIAENRRSSTVSETRSSAVTGDPPGSAKRTVTSSIASTVRSPGASERRRPRHKPAPHRLEGQIGRQAQQPDGKHPEQDYVSVASPRIAFRIM